MDLTAYILFGVKDALFNDCMKNTLQNFKIQIKHILEIY